MTTVADLVTQARKQDKEEENRKEENTKEKENTKEIGNTKLDKDGLVNGKNNNNSKNDSIDTADTKENEKDIINNARLKLNVQIDTTRGPTQSPTVPVFANISYSTSFFTCCFPKPPIVTTKPSLLPSLPKKDAKKCLVLDLDETLVHSSFKPVECDFVIPVEIDKIVHNVYVAKRPGVDVFLKKLAAIYEIVIFTASLAKVLFLTKYANPVLDALDTNRVVSHRLFRDSCIHHKGTYVKDLSLLGRNLKTVIIIDNSPSCYQFQPENAIPVSSWFDDQSDQELLDLIPFLIDLNLVENVCTILDNSS
jgi:Dullard-like phosphatase family protein